MKKLKYLILGAFIAASVSLSAQTVERVDEVVVNQVGIEKLIVEVIDLTGVTGLPANSKAYRFFVDLENGYEFANIAGRDGITPQIPLEMSTTTTFFNETTLGSGIGENSNPALYGFSPLLEWDTYVTDGYVGPSEVGVLTSVNPSRRVPVDASSEHIQSVTVPNSSLLDLIVTGTASSMSDIFGFWGVAGNIGGPAGTGNTVYVAQFTTDGDIALSWNIATSSTSGLQYANEVKYPAPVNADPTINIVYPTGGETVNKNEVVTVDYTVNDPDAGENIALVEFYANGSKVDEDINPAENIQQDFDYQVLAGPTATFKLVVTDDQGAKDSASVTINVTDPNPINVSLSGPATSNLNTITLTATASDDDDGITSVVLLPGSIPMSQVGTTNTYEADYTPSGPGSVSFTAQATNGAGATAESQPPVVVTFSNDLPTVSITSPASGFVLDKGAQVTFVADAQDNDGTVQSVKFTIDDGTVFTDNAAPFEYVYTGGTIGPKSITAVANDGISDGPASAPVTFEVILPVGAAKYEITSISQQCNESDIFCMPVKALSTVAGVIGYDVEMKYDATKIEPTGVVIVAEGSEGLIADRDFTDYNMNVVGDSIIRLSIWISVPQSEGEVSFNGDVNDVAFCVEFSRKPGFGFEETTDITVPSIIESYPSSTEFTSAFPGTYSTFKDNTFEGKVSFWSDNSPMGGLNPTDIYNENEDAASKVTTDANGNFTYDTDFGTSIKIKKDVVNTFDVQPVISGQDAYLTSKVTVEDENFTPNVYQIIAMDVNRDNLVTAGDITQMQRRTVGLINEFTQLGGASQDWVFLSSTTVKTNESYRPSDAYPRPDENLSDGTGYSRLNVPAVNDVIDLEGLGIIEDYANCPVIKDEEFKGILLGDVTGNFASQPNSVELKSGSANETVSQLTLNLGNAVEVASKVFEIPVYAASDVNISSYDFSFKYKGTYAFVSAIDVAGMEELCSANDNKLKCTAYNLKSFTNGEILKLRFEGKGVMNANDIEVVTSMINEKQVEFVVNTVTDIAPASLANVSVYPNPVTSGEELKVEVDALGANIALYDMTGRLVEIKEAVSNVTTFDLSSMAKGIYNVKVVYGENVELFKVVVE